MAKTKRGLIYAPTVGRGGVRRVAEVLAAEFGKARGWKWDILGQTFDELGERVAWPDEMAFTQIRPVDQLPLHPHMFGFLMEHRGAFFDHLKEVAGDYDVVFCPSPWWGFIGLEPISTPVVSFVPDFAFDHMDIGMIGQYFRGISPIIAKHSRVAVFPSQWQQEHGEATYGFKGETIYFSADFTARDFKADADNALSVRLKYGLPESYVLAFHCYGHKGAEVIIRAQGVARRMHYKVPPLVIAGLQTQHYLSNPPDNDHVKLIQDTIRECSGVVGRDVFILGAIPDDDLGGLYAGAAVAITASRSEGGLSGTMLEAISAGVPLVASDLPVFRERLDDYDVWFFPVDDARSAGSQLVTACADIPNTARGRAEAVQAKFDNYTVKDVIRQYLDVFRRVIDG